MAFSGSQTHRWSWELLLFLSGLPGSSFSCNTFISQVLLVYPLWKEKKPPLGLCSLLERANAPPPSRQAQPGQLFPLPE